MKKTIDLENELEVLKTLHPSSPVSLSYENIMNKIKLAQRERAPKALLASSIISLVLVLSCNLWAIDKKTNSKEQNLVEDMGLMNHLSIYSVR